MTVLCDYIKKTHSKTLKTSLTGAP